MFVWLSHKHAFTLLGGELRVTIISPSIILISETISLIPRHLPSSCHIKWGEGTRRHLLVWSLDCKGNEVVENLYQVQWASTLTKVCFQFKFSVVAAKGRLGVFIMGKIQQMSEWLSIAVLILFHSVPFKFLVLYLCFSAPATSDYPKFILNEGSKGKDYLHWVSAMILSLISMLVVLRLTSLLRQ